MDVQTFNTIVASADGDVLFVGEDVAFRRVTPEHIKKAMESQAAEDDQKLYETDWQPVLSKEIETMEMSHLGLLSEIKKQWGK